MQEPSSKNIGPTPNDTTTSPSSTDEFWNPSIYSAEDSHAKTFHLPGNAAGSKEKEQLFGLNFSDSFASLNPDGSWAKMFRDYFQQMTDGSLETFSETWPASGTMLNGKCFLRPGLEPRILDEEFSFWPTPRANKIGGNSSPNFSPTLEQAIKWPTPRANERGQYQRDRGEKGKERPTLTGKVKMFPTPRTTGLDGGSNSRKAAMARGMWPTPKARDGKSAGMKSEMKRHTPSLNAVVKFTTPQARDWKGPSGRSLKGEESDLPSQIGGQLNPTWVEWLMGFPLGWTVLDVSVTRLFRKLRKKSEK